MKRSEFKRKPTKLTAGKGLKPGKGLSRGKAMARTKLNPIGSRRKREEPALRVFRREIRRRCRFRQGDEFRWRCECCQGVLFNAIDVHPHHITMRSRRGNYHDPEKNGAGVCGRCHTLIHEMKMPNLERWLR